MAETLKLNPEKFGHCLDSGGQAPAIAKTLAEGKRLGMTGTPSFVINGHFISGATDYETLRDLIEQELASPEPRQTKTAANNS
jgi:protein-disulfide isomerase